MSKVLSEMGDARGRKMCLHPLAGESCSGGAIKAHTVPRASLRKIAREGHVYSISGDLPTLGKTGGNLSTRLVGLSKASIFTGFCAYHDHGTFQPFEAGVYESMEQASFLLGYRALCLELFNKLGVDSLDKTGRELDKGRELSFQLLFQAFHAAHHNSVKIAIRDMQEEKKGQDHALMHSDYSQAEYLLFELRRAPDIMCSGGLTPQYDFGGNQLQDLADPAPAESLAFSAIAKGDGGWLLFSWFGAKKAPRAFTRSLLGLGEDSIPHAVVRLIFESFENTYLAPVWWEALEERQRSDLLARLQRAVDLREERLQDCLKDDGIKAVKWQITGTHSNVGL